MRSEIIDRYETEVVTLYRPDVDSELVYKAFTALNSHDMELDFPQSAIRSLTDDASNRIRSGLSLVRFEIVDNKSIILHPSIPVVPEAAVKTDEDEESERRPDQPSDE